MKYSDAILLAHEKLLAEKKTIIVGQGVRDHKRLWGTIPEITPINNDRIVDVPLSEDSVAGMCLGLALNGFLPINTHIRADFSLLAFNQIINMGAKYKYMFAGKFSMHSIFRLVVGRSWGQGAQHSQSFHTLLGHIPGVRVFSPATSRDVLDCYDYAARECDCPCIIFEHRLLYGLNFFDKVNDSNIFQGTKVEVTGTDITVVASSLMVVEACRLADKLKKYDIKVEVINLIDITFPCAETIINSVKKTKLLLVADISWQKYGLASEVIKIISQDESVHLMARPEVVGSPFAPCPTAKALEDLYHPSLFDLVCSAKKLLSKKDIGANIPEPHRQSSTDYFKHFKGPF